MTRIIFIFLAFVLSGCSTTGTHQTAQLVSKFRTELKEKYGIKHGDVVAKFDLENIGKDDSKLFASYYGSAVNNNSSNRKVLDDFSKKYRYNDLIQSTAYKKLGMLNNVLLQIDKKHKFFGGNVRHKLASMSAQFKKHPEHSRKDKKDYLETLAWLHDATKYLPIFVPMDNAKVSSPFGTRNHPHKKKKIHHAGLDLMGKMNCHVYAAADGVVEVIARAQGYGNMIIVRHSKDVKTRYAHLSKMVAYEGNRVLQGQLIGHQGCSGTATGHHLHFEVIVRNQAVDPMLFIGSGL